MSIKNAGECLKYPGKAVKIAYMDKKAPWHK